jgi:diguanylate cyclase (GGDEF)-like protein
MWPRLLLAEGLLVDTAALAAVALIGYIFGRRTRNVNVGALDAKLQSGLNRARCIASELEHIATRLRTELAGHQIGIAAFQSQVKSMLAGGATADWNRLGEQAEALLGPTMKLATNLSHSYDQLRNQQARLATFAGSRIDLATGLHNRRSMEEQLDALLSTSDLANRRLSLALFSVQQAAGDGEEARDMLKPVARLLEECVRQNDLAARYSEDEFVVLMPKTTLAGALVFSERLIRMAGAELGQAVWGGVVEAAPGEQPSKLLSRADSALYSARTHETASLFQHNGASVRRYPFDLPAAQQAPTNSGAATVPAFA